MGRSESLFPMRHSNALPRTSSFRQTPISIHDEDELATDTVPCSPGAMLRYSDAITQPTQILPLPDMSIDFPSSPPSVVEVPASSPFREPVKRTLGTRLAPAGTVFRPPQQQTMKRPAPEDPIDLISDDDQDLSPPRGDIKPTTFKAQMQSFKYDQDNETVLKKKLRQVYDVFGNKFTPSFVREALSQCSNDVEETIAWLEGQGSRQASSERKTARNGRRLVSKASLQARPKAPSPTPSPPRPPQRRRLVQGRRPRNDPDSQMSLPDAPLSDDPLIIDLVDNDKEDAYQERSPTPDDDDNDKVLQCMNTSTIQELAAMTGMKESLLEPIIENRPYGSLSQARRVGGNKAAGARKAPRNAVGQTAADAIEVFLDAANAIDAVVGKCDKQAKMIKRVMDTWDLDVFGHSKLSRRGSLDSDLPPTPTSLLSSKFVRPPVSRQPDYMEGHCQMKPFQLFGLNWMSLLHDYKVGCILADEMGLGKTCQVISLMCHLVERYESQSKGNRPWPNLIVVPPSTYNNWLAEFVKFAPEISVIGYRGSQAERAEIAYEVENNSEAYHVVLATYSQINNENDIEAMRSFKLHASVFDEGHKMKNPETKVYKDLRRIPSKWKMLLTGTPVQNNLLEMTALLSFINPDIFDGYMEHIRYIFSHKVNVRDVSNGAFLYSERVKRARTILEPFILQRRKDQVLSDMPQKTCTVVSCDMTAYQKTAYDEYETVFKTEPAQRVTKTQGRQNDQNNVWMQLRKAAIHPLLFRRHFTDEKVDKMAGILMDRVSQDELCQKDIKHLIGELKNSSDFELHLWCRDYPRLLSDFDYPPQSELDSGKVKKLLELIDEYKKNGDRVLVFSKFSRVIEMLREVLALKQIDHRVLMGATNVSERQTMIDEFNSDSSIPVFLLTTGAGGTGINLTSANKVVIFDQSDNPQDDIQAENRAHRLGQKRDVEIVRLISTGTIEELIAKACQKKIELAEKVTGAASDGSGLVIENMEKEVRKMMKDSEGMTPP